MSVSNTAPTGDGDQLFRRRSSWSRSGSDRGSSGHRGHQDLVRMRRSSGRKIVALRRHRHNVSDHSTPEQKRELGGREVDRLRAGQRFLNGKFA